MAQPAGELTVGTIVAETYRVTGLLGQGGMGAVWAADHLRLPGRQVAIKVLLADVAADSELYARFRREAEIASRLGHPNIVQVLDWNTLPSGAPYLVLELLRGESLAARLARGPLALAEALAIARQVGSALTAAHRAEVVHRDLKPDNIFLCPSEQGLHVKVLDFGISKIRNSQTVQTQESALLGTPQYMSPEQAHGRNQLVDQRTDQFALGAIVYEMLTGRPAFFGETLAQVILRVVGEPAPSLTGTPGVPAAVAAAVARALEKEPERRFPDVTRFLAALDGAPPVDVMGATLAPGSPAPDSAAPSPRAERAAVATPSAKIERAAVATPSLRGELAPVSNPHPRSARPLALVAAVVVAAAAAAALLPRRSAPPGAPVAPLAAATPARSSPAAPSAADLAIAVDLGAARPAVAAPDHPARRERAPSPAVPDAALADLAAADAALDGGDASEAIRLARRTLNLAKTSRAFSIIARAFCLRGDLGNAKAAFFSVAPADRPTVRRACLAREIHL